MSYERSTPVSLLVLFSLILFGNQVLAEDKGWHGSCAENPVDVPVWVSRCYDGKVTLANFDSIESIQHRLKSDLSWLLTSKLVNFEAATTSGQLVSGDQVMALSLFLIAGGHLGWAHDLTDDGTNIRLSGPVIAGNGFDTHQRVRIFYSDGVVRWLKNDREGDIPDGSVIVKQMYSSDPTDVSYGADRVSGWAVMIKNSKLSHDGWIWYLFFFPGSPPYNAPLPVVYAQAGDNFCLSCHAAADNTELTYSAIENLEGVGQKYTWIDTAFPYLFAKPDTSQVQAHAYAGGVTQFQQAVVLDKNQQAQLGDLKKNSWKAIDDGLDELGKPKNKEKLLAALKSEAAANSPVPAAQIRTLEVLLEKALIDLGKALKDHNFRGILTYAMEDYWRFITQEQTVVPLDKPDPAILKHIGEGTTVDLVKNQSELPWYSLDLIFSHTPALPKELPSDICAMYDGRLLDEQHGGFNTPEDCRDVYVTSDNCNGCHWSYVLQGNSFPSMVEVDPVQPPDTGSKWPVMSDFSQYNEWSASMMGLAGKDPIFHAQLSWERENRPEQADQISNFCLRCHQPGAQRQFHIDQGTEANLAVIYPPDEEVASPLFTGHALVPPNPVISAEAKYAALGRDGITCTVCHTILPDGLGSKETFTGQFKYPDKPGNIFGPYPSDDVKPYYMQQAIGMTPVHGAQIQDAGLCGSCHTVITPILSERSETVPDGYQTTYEQTTYPEWLNSDYNADRGGSDDLAQTCQECHMPSILPSAPDAMSRSVTLKEVIANVETQFLPDLPNRAADDKLALSKKPYRRHTLLGLNVFANQMFQQFPEALGNTKQNTGGVPAKPQLVLAEQEMIKMGASNTVEITVAEARKATNGNWVVDVSVENLTGHKFPTGVGFRRAFLAVEAYDAAGNAIWASGRVNTAGLIVDENGSVLEQEMTTDPSRITTGESTIGSQSDVYIFESRMANVTDTEAASSDNFSDLVLTTSFLEIAKEVKDTRLLPKGWVKDGPYADVTYLKKIEGSGADKKTVPFYPATPGKRNIRYEMDTAGKAVAKVEATMIYQAIPPYYIRDRLQYNTEAIRRFYFMVANLKTKGTVIEDWAFRIKCASSTKGECR